MASETYYVEELLKAEEEANKIIKAAQKTRENKLKQAREAAEAEIQAFRNQKEEEYRKMQERKEDKEFEMSLKRATDQEIQQINKDYERNKQKVIDLLLANILKVDLEIPQTIKEKFVKKE